MFVKLDQLLHKLLRSNARFRPNLHENSEFHAGFKYYRPSIKLSKVIVCFEQAD